MKSAHLVPGLLILALLASPLPARADVAPPEQPPGSNVEPGSQATQVRMMAETVIMEVKASPTSGQGQASVVADFTMRNLGQTVEEMAARFPLGTNDGFFNFPEIADLRVLVDGAAVATRRIEQPDPRSRGDIVPWAAFDVSFPPGQDVNIQVTYTLQATGEWPYISFLYLLHTGAGWKDTIGSADLIVRLPFEVNAHNVFLEDSPGFGRTTPGGLISGSEIRWHYENLEPTTENDLGIVMVMPGVWRAVLDNREAVAQNPESGAAWRALADSYDYVSRLRRGTRYDAGGRELYQLGVEAYERAIALLPDDADLQVSFADVLWNHYLWNESFTNPVNPEVVRALEALDRALKLDPGNERAVAILDDMAAADEFFSFSDFPEVVRKEDDRYVLLWLTATPVFTPTEVAASPSPTSAPPTATLPPATAMLPVTRTATARPAAPTAPSTPASPQPGLCGSALLLAGVGLVTRRKKKS